MENCSIEQTIVSLCSPDFTQVKRNNSKSMLDGKFEEDLEIRTIGSIDYGELTQGIDDCYRNLGFAKEEDNGKRARYTREGRAYVLDCTVGSEVIGVGFNLVEISTIFYNFKEISMNS